MKPRGPGQHPLRNRPNGPFAANLRLLIERRGTSASELADLLDDCPRRMRRLATGATLPHYAEIPALARLLDVSATDLAWTDTERLAARIRRPAA